MVVDIAEVLDVHVHVVGHVGVGGLLSVGVVPTDHENFLLIFGAKIVTCS